MMKRYLSLLTACVLLSLCVCCAQKPVHNEAEQAPVVITIATFLYSETPHRKVFDELVQTYNQAHPGVRMEIDSAFCADYDNNLASGILSNDELDIVQLYPADLPWFDSLREGGAFLNLSALCEGTELSANLTGQFLANSGNRVLGLSNYGWGVPAIYYRRSMLAEKGIEPTSIRTQEDFKKVCLRFTADGNAALSVCYGSNPYGVYEWSDLIAKAVSGGLYFSGGESRPYTAERLHCDSEANIWAAQWWNDFIAADRCANLVLEKKDAREAFWNGEVPFCIDEPCFIAMCQEYGEELVADIGVIPLFNIVYDEQLFPPRPALRPVVSCISSKSRHIEEAWDFLVWMTSEEAQRIIAGCGLIPASVSYSTSERYAAQHVLSAQFQGFLSHDYGTLIQEPSTPRYARLREIMQDAAMEIFTDVPTDVRPVLEDARREMEAVLTEY